MPIQPTYPGVYVQEVPSGVRTIMGVSTSIAMFIGRAKWGPDNEPFQCLNYSDFDRAFTSDNSMGDLARAVRLFFLNGGTRCYVFRLTGSGAAQSTVTIQGSDTKDSVVIQGKYKGTLGSSVHYIIENPIDGAGTFDLTLYRQVTDQFGATQPTDKQKWTGVSIISTSPRFVTNYVDYKWATVSLAPGAVIPVKPPVATPDTALPPGNDGLAPDLASPITDYDKAYNVIDKEVDLFNLMILPKDTAFSDDNMASLWAKASIFCQKRRAFLLMDPRSDWHTVQNATDGMTSLRTGLVKDYSALFFPCLTLTENGSPVQVGPGGAIAGLMARIDSNRGVWKAPAGTEADIRGINGLEYKFSDDENGVLNPRGINTLRVFPEGIVNWGARTMDGDDDFQSEYKYIPIRRLALYLEESLYRGLKWVVFEPNDEPLWAQIRLNAGAFMHDLFRQGAFQGSTPKEAYFVKCDAETTIQSDRDKGIVNIWVGFAPLKPAEFVMIYIQQMAGQINQ